MNFNEEAIKMAVIAILSEQLREEWYYERYEKIKPQFVSTLRVKIEQGKLSDELINELWYILQLHLEVRTGQTIVHGAGWWSIGYLMDDAPVEKKERTLQLPEEWCSIMGAIESSKQFDKRKAQQYLLQQYGLKTQGTYIMEEDLHNVDTYGKVYRAKKREKEHAFDRLLMHTATEAKV